MPVAGPFYLALVDETDNSFGPGHLRMDEYVFSARRILAEGEKPKLILVIENPRVGLLSALRKQWCWFSWDNGSEVVPLFFGRINSIPSDIQSETMTVTFIAWPSNYKKQLQRLAETLKGVGSFFDPLFIDVSKRDDPMAIFESHSALPCTDPVTHVVTAEDILTASDGNVDFTQDDHFYDSLHTSPGTVPKTAIHVDMTVSWTQTARGYIDMGKNVFTTFSGDGLLSEWPKPLSNVAPGLTVFSSAAYDNGGTANIFTETGSWSWTNTEREHSDGDTLSTNISWSTPQISTGFAKKQLTFFQQFGFLDPFATDGNGDPAPKNIPPKEMSTDAYVPKWTISTSLVLEYMTARPHTERVIFRLFADVQPTTVDAQVSEDSETLSLPGADVGVPIIELLNWTTISSTFVAVGTVVFPDDPQLPGGGTAQRVVVAGVTGALEPDFSNVVGDLTVDGGAVWASLGVAAPTENSVDWTGVSNVPAGQMILPRRPLFATWFYFTLASRLTFPPQGTSVSEGTIIQSSDGSSFQVCTLSGITERTEPSFSATWGTVTSDGSAEWTSLGASLPDGKTFFIATTGGQTGAQFVIPSFNTALHATTSDGSVVWTAVGQGEIPIGGTPGNVTASSYFDKARGRRSLEYGILRARTRLRYASRCVTTQFECAYTRGTELTLRKTATLHDYRLPGGLILGKITGTELVADSGSFTCNVTIQSSVGKATTVVEVEGDPTYVAAGYVANGYQTHDNSIVLLPTLSDVGYSPLVPVADEDGISFPLEKSMIVVAEGFMGGDQGGSVGAGLNAMAQAAQMQAEPGTNDAGRQRAIAMLQSNGVSEQLKRAPNWYEVEFKPLNGNGAFNHVYHLTCTTLSLPKMIDLQGESTT